MNLASLLNRWLGVFLALLITVGCGDARSSPELGLAFPGSLFSEAEAVYFSGQYDSARVLFRGLLASARGENGSQDGGMKSIPAEAQAITWLGLIAWRLGEYGQARTLGEEALSLKLDHGLTEQLFRSYNALGLLAWNESRLSDAKKLYDQAILSANETGKQLEAATARGNLALVQTELGEFSDAREGFLTMRAQVAELGETRIEGNALTNLGMLEIRTGHPNAAIPFLQMARTKYDSVPYPTGTLSALGQLGTAYAALGEPRKAFAVLDSALSLSREQGLQQEEASNLEALAELYREAGDFQRSLSLYDEAKGINAELGLDVETGADLRGEADIEARLGDLARAHTLAEEALLIHRAAGARLDELMDLLLLAEIQDQMRATRAVQATLHRARTIAKELDARVARIEVALTEARIAQRNGDHQSAIEITADISGELARGGFASEWEANLIRSRALAGSGQPDSAMALGYRALAAMERVRSGYGSGFLRSAYAADKKEVYSHLVSLLLDQGRVAAAFEVADAARGRAVIEQMAVTGIDPSSQSAAGFLKRGEGILREIDQLVESIDYLEEIPTGDRTNDQDAELGQLYGRIVELRAEHGELSVRAAEIDASAAAILGGAPVRLAEVQQALRPGQMLVEYLLGSDDAVLIFAVTQSEVRFFPATVDATNLASRIRLARDQIAAEVPAGARGRNVLAGLYEGLLGPVMMDGISHGTTEIIFVPHGVTNYLPFSALVDTRTDRYLAQEVLVRVLPSAGVLPALATEYPDGLPPLESVAVLAPFPEELPASVHEADAIGRGMPATRQYLGDRATEDRLRQTLGTSDVVHVASHGVLNRGNPMYSRLELVRGGGGPSDDGRFEVHELFGVSIESEMVFLSGCETGIGPSGLTSFGSGEDFATLAQAFLYAGAKNVVATLWPVEDEGAAAFAEEFYRSLETGSPTLALAEAQRAMLRRGDFSSPYYWAGYQVVGAEPVSQVAAPIPLDPSAPDAHKPGWRSVEHY